MGKQVKNIDFQEEVEDTTDVAGPPTPTNLPSNGKIDFEEEQPVKKKESVAPYAPQTVPTDGPRASVLPSGKGSFVDAELLQKSSGKPTPTDEEKTQALEYLSSVDAKARAEWDKQRNPLIAAGKTLWSTIGYQTPAGVAGTGAAVAPGLYQAALLEQGGSPDFKTPEQMAEASRKNTAQARKDMLAWAYQHQKKGQVLTQDLINTLDKVQANDPVDWLNWASAALGQATGQIPAAVLTAGTSSLGQEVGSIYMDGLEKTAAERGITVNDVIDQNLDEPAFALAFGAVAAALDRIGAGKVMSSFGKEAAKKAFRDRALAGLKSAGTEAVTEYSQTYLEQLGQGMAGGKSFEQSFQETQTPEAAKERLESAAQGFVGGGALNAIGEAPKMSPRQVTQVVTDMTNVNDQQSLEAGAEVIQAKVDSQQTEVEHGITDAKPITVDEANQAAAVAFVPEGEVSETQAETEATETAPSSVQYEDRPVAPDNGEAKAIEEPQQQEPVVNEADVKKERIRKEIDALVESGDLARENGKVTVLTRKGGEELFRIVDENGVPYKNVTNAVQESSAEGVPVRERTGGGEEVPSGNTEGDQTSQEGQSQETQVNEQQGQPGTVQQPNESITVNNGDRSNTEPVNSDGVNNVVVPSDSGVVRRVDEGNQPEAPTETEAGKEPVREPGMRKTWLRIKDDPNVSDQIKDGIATEAKEYVPRSLKKVTQHEADVIIDWLGNDLATKMYLDDDNGMSHDVDTALGARLFEKLQKEGEYQDAIRVFEKLAKKGTELGQAVNAYKLLQGKTMLFVVDRALRKSRKTYKKMNRSKGEKAKDTIDEINQNAVNQVLQADTVQKAKKGRASSVKKAIDFLETLKVDTKGKALDVAFGITAAAWNTVITAVQKGLEAGLTITQAIDKAVSKVTDPNFKKKEAIEYLDEKLATYRVTLDPERAIKAELKSQGKSVDDIIREHFKSQQSTRKNLIDKLIKDGNVPAEQAQEIADAIAAKFDELTRKAKERALEKIVPKSSKKVTPKQRKDTIDKLIEQSNLGALSEDQYLDTIAEDIGVPKLDTKQASEIQKLTDAIQNAKGDQQRSKAAQDLYNYIENLNGWSWLDAVESIWFANMLSGPTTWLVTNPFANATNLVMEAAIDIKRNPKHAGFILSRIASGLTRGLIQAGDVLRTGYDPYKGENYKTEATPLLERITFKGGKVNPLNWLKYVTRAIKAGDVIFYQGLKEQRYAVLALNEAHKNGRSRPNKADMDSLYGKLMAGNYDAALEQAQGEGLKGSDAKMRAYEIMEENLPEMAVKEAENFAARATFNMKPEGALGAVAEALNTMRRKVPIMKVVVPFVNTIINVANEYLNYNPVVGAWRVASGNLGFKGWGDTYRELSKEERARIAIKTIIGTVAMAALAALDDEEEDSKIEITADGTGDIKDNYELQRKGWRPYSIRIGDTWYSYKNTPLAMPLAMVGFWKDAARYGANPDRVKKTEIAMMGSWKVFQDMSTLSGLADFFDLMNKDSLADLEKGAKGLFRFLERTAKAAIVPNYFTQMSRLVQEVTESPMKKAESPGETIIRDMPVLRDHMNNLYDSFGDPVVAKQMEKFLPFNAARKPEDAEMFKFLADHKLFVGVVGKSNLKPDGSPMTEEEYQEFALESARAIKKRVMREYKRYTRKGHKNEAEIKDWFDDVKREERRDTKLKLFR